MEEQTMDEILQIKDLTKSYRDFKLDDTPWNHSAKTVTKQS